jgi:YVTN family beta-propeller protein
MLVPGGSGQFYVPSNLAGVPPSCDAGLSDTGAGISVGVAPSRAVITPGGTEVYVSNNGSNTVSVISSLTGTVTHTIPVGSSPDALAVSPGGAKVYVGQHGGGVSVIDTATKSVAAVNTLGGPVRDLAITPDGSKVYLAMEFAGLKKIDTATNAVSVVSGFACPEGVAVTPDGSTLYVNYQCGGPGGSGGHDAVGRFNAGTGAFLGSITGLPNVGSRLTISPDGAQVWENGGDACLSPFYDHAGCSFVPSGVVNVIAVATNTLQQSIGFAGFSPGLISFLPDSSRAAVGNGASLTVFETATFGVVQTLPLPASGSLAFAPDGKAYAPVPGQNRVAVLAVGDCAPDCTPPPPNMVSWWPAEGDASDIWDGNDGALQNGATLATGMVGQAFSFDGADDDVEVPYAPNLDVGGGLTIDFWMKSDPDNTMSNCCQGLVTTDFYAIEISGGGDPVVGVNFFINTGSGFVHTSDANGGGAVVSPGVWHHVAGTYDGTKLQLYIDGQPFGNPRFHSGAILPMLTGSYLAIGSEDGRMACPSCIGNRYFKGMIDEVEIFNRALTGAEIQAIYNAGSAGKCPPDNRPPAADAGVDQTVECAGATTSVTLDGTASTDPDGDSLAYDWSEGAIPLGTGATLTTQLGLGSHTLTLTVTDPDGALSTDTVVVNIVDTVAPSLSAPPAVSVPTGAGATSCGAFVSDDALGSATATDGCSSSVSVIRSGVPPANIFPVGTTIITYTATDASGNASIATQSVHVFDDTPPTLNAPPNISANNDAASCSATLDPGVAEAGDNCAGVAVAGVRSDGQPLSAPYTVGTTLITWTATDAAGNTASAVQHLVVNDTEAPTITGAEATPSQLWPPNHTMRDVSVLYSAADNCGAVNCVIGGVTSNEPADGTGDGDTAPDWEIVDAHHVRLRAERAGVGDGRIYSITIICTDSHGNSSARVVTVSVPKSQRK